MTIQTRLNRPRLTLVMVFFCSALVVAGWSDRLNAQSQRSSPIWAESGKTVRLAIFDAFEAVPLKNTAVTIFCEGPIAETVIPQQDTARAQGAAQGAHSWQGRTDGDGVVGIPRSALPGDCRVETATYNSTYIHDACFQPLGSAAALHWQIDLFPERLGKEGDFGTDGLKLLDDRTNKPLANVPVRIEFLVGGTLQALTNSRGFVFFGREKTFGRNAWVTAPGYWRKTLDFDSGPLFDVCGTKLQRQ